MRSSTVRRSAAVLDSDRQDGLDEAVGDHDVAGLAAERAHPSEHDSLGHADTSWAI